MKLLRNTPLQDTRIDQKNTPDFWVKVRNIASIVALIGGSILTTVASGGVVLPVSVITVISTVTAIAGGIAGVSSLTKK